MKITDIERTPNYIRVKMIADNNSDKTGRNATDYLAEMYDMQAWCQRNGCGKRINVKCFAFKTEQEFTMFQLRWLS